MTVSRTDHAVIRQLALAQHPSAHPRDIYPFEFILLLTFRLSGRRFEDEPMAQDKQSGNKPQQSGKSQSQQNKQPQQQQQQSGSKSQQGGKSDQSRQQK